MDLLIVEVVYQKEGGEGHKKKKKRVSRGPLGKGRKERGELRADAEHLIS